MNWMLLPYRRYAEFSGRSRRKEYWLFALLQIIVAIVALSSGFLVDSAATGTGLTLGMGVYLLFALASFIPAIAVQVRRFHDQNRSGWMVLLNFIPYLGGLIVLVLMCLDGTPGPNRFGPDPKGRENLPDHSGQTGVELR